MDPPSSARAARGGNLAALARQLAAAKAGERPALLGSSPEGLTSTEARARLARFGANVPVADSRRRPWLAFGSQFVHSMALLLWFAAGLSFASGITELGFAIVAVVVTNGVFAFIQGHRAERVVEGLMRRVAVRARAVRDGSVAVVSATELVPGDVVRLAAGDVVPADCTVLESADLRIDLSMLTGESTPVERSAEASATAGEHLQMIDAPSLLPAGAAVVAGTATALVWATGPESTLGAVAGLVTGVHRGASILERQVAALSRTTAVVAVLVGATTLTAASLFTETSFLAAMTFGTGALVALVPEGLLPALSVSLAIGARKMASRGAAVRRLTAVEVVGSATVICTDKTGTLTTNRLSVRTVVAPDGSDRPTADMLLVAVLCNEADANPGVAGGDPIDVALLHWAVASGLDAGAARAEWPRTDTAAFDPRRKYMSVTCTAGSTSRTFVKGAPEAVGELLPGGEVPATLAAAIAESASRGERPLLLAASGPAGDLAACGALFLADPPRPGVAEAAAACHRAGIRIVMLTGDHLATAQAVASQVGMAVDPGRCVEGRALETMTDSELRNLLREEAVVARVDPEQKLRVVRVLQAAGEVVVVTGDGVNDAPALRAADVGVAMGLRGTEVAKQSADIVLADDNFVTIVAAIEEGRAIRANIRRFMSYVFTSNVAEMTPFLVYIFLPVPLPLAVIQALAIDIGTDLVPALALGTEPPAARAMDHPPEPPRTPLLTPALALRTFLFFGLVEATLGLAGFFTYYAVNGWEFGSSFGPFSGLNRGAATVTFLAIVGGQVGCLFAQRDGSLRQRLAVWRNPWIAWGLAFELVVAVALVYTPVLNRAVSMEALDAAWLLAVPAAAIAFVALDQVRRLAEPGRGRRAGAGSHRPPRLGH